MSAKRARVALLGTRVPRFALHISTNDSTAVLWINGVVDGSQEPDYHCHFVRPDGTDDSFDNLEDFLDGVNADEEYSEASYVETAIRILLMKLGDTGKV